MKNLLTINPADEIPVKDSTIRWIPRYNDLSNESSILLITKSKSTNDTNLIVFGLRHKTGLEIFSKKAGIHFFSSAPL